MDKTDHFNFKVEAFLASKQSRTICYVVEKQGAFIVNKLGKPQRDCHDVNLGKAYLFRSIQGAIPYLDAIGCIRKVFITLGEQVDVTQEVERTIKKETEQRLQNEIARVRADIDAIDGITKRAEEQRKRQLLLNNRLIELLKQQGKDDEHK